MEDDYGTLQIGVVAVLSEKPVRKKKPKFPFGFQAPPKIEPAKTKE